MYTQVVRRWAIIAAATGLAVFALAGWQAISTVGRNAPLDSREYLINAEYLSAHHSLPPDYVSYEYSAPPLYEALAVVAERAVTRLPALQLELSSNLATRILWLALLVASVVLLTARRGRLRLLGIVGLTLTLLWGLDEAILLARSEQWSAGQFIALGSALGLIVCSGLIAREVWPGHPGRALAVAGLVAAYPVVLRLGSLFHPETTMAFLSALAIWLTLRAIDRGWPTRLGALVGLVCGLDLLTRQSAVVVLFCVLVTALWCGRAHARGFVLATVLVTAALAGPWLGYAAYTWGNPLQGNLERPGDMIPGGEPLSFYVSFPLRSLVLHPYREDFGNQLLPQLHADLWSDWYGAFHPVQWADPSTADRVTASTQSVLGLFGDALALGGLAVVGIAALVRVTRRRGSDGDAGLALLALVPLVGFLALTTQIVRYPQYDGKEVKASYLMFAAPSFAVFTVAACLALARRRAGRLGLVALGACYAVSYTASLGAAFGHNDAPYDAMPAPYGYVDLRLAVQGPSGTQTLAAEPDVNVTVTNAGTETADEVQLHIDLPHGMKLLGPPSYQRGSGCTGSTSLNCYLDFLPAGMSTPIDFAVRLTRPGLEQITTAVSSYELDAHPANLQASLTTLVPRLAQAGRRGSSR